MKKILATVLSAAMLLMLLIVPMASLTANAAGSLTLAYDSMPGGSHLYMTFTADAEFAQKYYLVEATVDGTVKPLLFEVGPDWAPTNAFIWSLNATSSFEIAAGALFCESDANWNEIVGGKQLTLTETFKIEGSGENWAPAANAPAIGDLTLAYDSMPGGSHLYMTFTADAEFAQKYYLVEATVDGTVKPLLFEVGPDWAPTNAFIWSLNATSSFEIAAGALFCESDANWNEIVGGKQLTLTETFKIEGSGENWAPAANAPTPTELAVDTTQGTGGYMGSWANGNQVVSSVKLVSSPVVGGGAWLTLYGQVDVAGTPTDVVVTVPDNGEWWFGFDSLPTEYSVSADTVFVSDNGTAYSFTKDLTVNASTGATYADPAVEPLDKTFVFYDAANDNWRFAVEDVSNLTAGQWYTADITVDGATRTVLFEYCEGVGFYIYNHCFGATPGSAACPASSVQIAAGTVLTPISTPDASAVVAGGQTLRIAEAIVIVKDGDNWGAPDTRPVIEIDMTNDDVNADHPVNYNSNNNRTWIWVRTNEELPGAAWTVPAGTVTVNVDGVDYAGCIAQKLDDADNKGFQIMIKDANCTNASKITIAAGSEYELEGTVLRFTEDFVLEQVSGIWGKEGTVVPPVVGDLSLTYDSMPSGSLYMTFTVDAEYTQKYYLAAVTVDGTVKTLVIEIGPDWAPTNAFIWGLNATTTVAIAEGTLLCECDPNTGTEIAGGKRLKLTEKVEVINVDGAWMDKDAPPPVPPLDPVDVTLTFENINGNNDWAFSGEGTLPTVNTWYAAIVQLDGDERTLLFEYDVASGYFYIYHHCFWNVPNDSADLLPVESLVLDEGLVLSALSSPNAEDVTEGGQPLKLTAKVDMQKADGVWADQEAVIDLSDALEVGITIEQVDGTNILWLNAILADGTAIKDIYGDWTSAFGTVRLGTYNADGTVNWTVDQGAIFSLTGTYFHMSSISLANYDAIQIDAGTVVLPAATCNSDRPIVIANNFRIVRDENDEWVIDEEFTEIPDMDAGNTGDGGSSVPTGEKSNLPMILGIIAGLVVLLAVCGVLAAKKKKN